MIELLLFDLDNTLLRTTDLDPFRGPAGLNPPPGYQQALERAARRVPGREVYSQEFLRGLRITHPNLKIGIFTRAPRLYADTLLGIYYPHFSWDRVVARQDVTNTKPDPEGIYLAAQPFNITDGWRVALVGDDVIDVKAAYRAGIWSVADVTTWPYPLASPNYWVKERLPDALIKGPDELAQFLLDPQASQPLFDQWVQRAGPLPANVPKRVEVLNHFDKTPEGRAPVKISLMGRRFSDHSDYEHRRSWHPASLEIENNKRSTSFPVSWVGALRDFIRMHVIDYQGLRHTVTVIPAKPTRLPRLEALLSQLAQSHAADPICQHATLEFHPALLEYGQGALSHHGDHLNAVQRFENVRDHLRVAPGHNLAGRRIIVIDDVTTTGATLFYAYHYLVDSGAAATAVFPVSLTKAVST